MICSNIRKIVAISAVSLFLLNTAVQCIENGKTKSFSQESERWKLPDVQQSSSWSPEYYDASGGYRKDFVTSNYEDKYYNSNPLYTTKPRQGLSPFSGSGSFYSSGGVYDRRPLYGVARPIDSSVHDYDNPYDSPHQAYGYGLNHLNVHKDLTKSIWIPLAGAALLGIAAALVTNPVLLHLGVTAGKRKRRDTSTFNAHDLAYRAQVQSSIHD